MSNNVDRNKIFTKIPYFFKKSVRQSISNQSGRVAKNIFWNWDGISCCVCSKTNKYACWNSSLDSDWQLDVRQKRTSPLTIRWKTGVGLPRYAICTKTPWFWLKRTYMDGWNLISFVTYTYICIWNKKGGFILSELNDRIWLDFDSKIPHSSWPLL